MKSKLPKQEFTFWPVGTAPNDSFPQGVAPCQISLRLSNKVMAHRLAGMVVLSGAVDLVILDHESGNFEVVESETLELQTGPRPAAYDVLREQLSNRLRELVVESACIKGSAVSIGGTKKAHLDAAELRGVVQAAAASVCEVNVMNKAHTSRNFGSKKVDEYLRDDGFWSANGLQDLPKGKREAAFTVVSHLGK